MPKLGRPSIKNIKEDANYYKNYYHETKKDYVCECGAFINNHSKTKHFKTKKHFHVLASLAILNNKLNKIDSI